MKRSPLTWLRYKMHPMQMFWYFIVVYIMNRTLHGCLWIQILFACVNICDLFTLLAFERYYQHLEIKFFSTCGHVLSPISCARRPKEKGQTSLVTRNRKCFGYQIGCQLSCSYSRLLFSLVPNDLYLLLLSGLSALFLLYL